MSDLSDRYLRVRTRIQVACEQASRLSEDVTLLAVSKTRPSSDIRALAALGQVHFGENYLQEALVKQSELTDLPLCWHFIGPIQSNKTKEIANHFSWVHSLDRIKVAERLSKQRSDHLAPLNVCLQVNIDHESSKSGVLPEDLITLAQQMATLPRLKLRGLMAIPAAGKSTEQQHSCFASVLQLFNKLKIEHPELDTLSMGMSADLEAAIAEGTTLVRIGTDLFGAR